jgi:adenylate kinase family enzyme
MGRFNPERDTLVLDGIPRNIGQAEMLADTLDVLAAFKLSCADKAKLVERLQRRALRKTAWTMPIWRSFGIDWRSMSAKPNRFLDFYGPNRSM